MQTRAAILLLALAAPAASAQGLVEAGGSTGLALTYGDRDDGAALGVDVHGSSDFHADTWGLQVDGTAGYAATADDSESQAALALHPYARLGTDLYAGLYAAAGVAPDARFTLGAELAYAPPAGFGFELYLGESRGGGALDGGYSASRAISLYHTTVGDARYGVYGRKETLNASGSDADFYAYGLSAEIPLDGEGRNMLTAGAGQLRFDAGDDTRTEISLGFERLLGATPQRPTFGYRRAILPGLVRD